jgi:hypothetical protein
MSGNPVAWFEMAGPDARRLREGLSHGGTGF